MRIVVRRFASIAVAAVVLHAARVEGQAATMAAVTDTVCAHSAFRRFDFWAGDWTVRDTTGKVIGTSHVTRDVGGCALHEHWTAASPQEVGESFSAFAPVDGKWHQLYIGSGGYILSMSGGFEGDRLVMFVAPHPSVRDPKVQVDERWTWTPIDAAHVRQTAAVSTDGGKTWKTQFDGIYERTTR